MYYRNPIIFKRNKVSGRTCYHQEEDKALSEEKDIQTSCIN